MMARVAIREMRERFPDLPVIRDQQRVPRRYALKTPKSFGAVEVLQKPITPAWNPL